MANPALKNAAEATGSKYALVIAVAKRARQIVAKKDNTIFPAHKPVTAAIKEVLGKNVEVKHLSKEETSS